jgi:glyoxylase-like metal-dependent hydrolase (beta-lactamase superfamily II)
MSLDSGPAIVDLEFLGNQRIIATAVLRDDSGVALVDPGPSTTLPNLKTSLAELGIAVADIRLLLLTHIHLDHAGATGTLVKENPRVEVIVHERGAPHMIDPSKLLASAARLYGQDMDQLWGEFLPVPAERVRALHGGERIIAGGRELEVAYTPGHASHHVSYFDSSWQMAFVGDTAGILRPAHGRQAASGAASYVMPPTPPPDIDLVAWRASVERILSWQPEALFLTHFGAFSNPAAHFRELLTRLDEWSRIVQRLLGDPSLDDTARERRFVHEVMKGLAAVVGEEEAHQYSRAGRLDFSWQGLSRYWRKRPAQTEAPRRMSDIR